MWTSIPLSTIRAGADFTCTLRDWWATLSCLPTAEEPPGSVRVEWIDLVCHQVGALCTARWMAMPISKWQSRFPAFNVVLVYAVDRHAGELQIYGLVKLMQCKSDAPVSQQLIQRNWLAHSELLSRPISESLAHIICPTLETAHALNPLFYDSVHLDPIADAALIDKAIIMMGQFARCASAGEGAAVLTTTFNYTIETLRSVETQLAMAKMRFYMKLTLAGMAQGTNPMRVSDDDIVAKGIDALRLWTTALVNLLCPNEVHVLAAISHFKLPLVVRPTDSVSWMLSPAGVEGGNISGPQCNSLPSYMQIGIYDNTATMLSVYGRIASSQTMGRNTNAEAMLTKGIPSGVLLTTGTTASLKITKYSGGGKRLTWAAPATRDSPGGSSEHAVFDEQLPVSLFMRLHVPLVMSQSEEYLSVDVLELRQCLVRWLVAFLAHNMIELTLTTRISVICELDEASGVLFFGVQELVFKGGSVKMQQFVCSWMAQYRLTHALLPLVPPDSFNFVAHLHPQTFSAFDKQAGLGDTVGELVPSLLRASSSRTMMRNLPHAVTIVPPVGMGEPFGSRAFGSWVASRVVVDLEVTRIEICNKFGGDIKRYAKDTLGSAMATICEQLEKAAKPALSLRLQDLVVRAASNHKPGGNNCARVVFESDAFKEVEARIAATDDSLEQFFRHLYAGSEINSRGRGGTVMRADRHFVFNVAGDRRMSWRDFSLDVHGRGLGTLVQHRLSSLTALEILDYLNKWASGHAPAPGTPNTPRVFNVADIESKRAQIIEQIKRYNGVNPSSVANRYLRITRGLCDADEGLIENNPCLFSGSRDHCPCGKEGVNGKPAGPTLTLPTLVCVTQMNTGLQRTFIVPSTLKKISTPGYEPKMSFGSLTLEDGTLDPVVIRQGPVARPNLVIIAEGNETALSVANALRRARVYSALGIGNIRKFSVASASIVLVCMENSKPADEQEPLSPKQRDRLRMKLEQRTEMMRCLSKSFAQVVQIWPPKPFGDFNDIHQAHPGAVGSAMVREIFNQQMAAAGLQSEYEHLVQPLDGPAATAAAVISGGREATNKRPR